MFFEVLAASLKTKPSFVILDSGQKTNNPYPKKSMVKKNVTVFIAELQQKLSSTTQSFFEYLTVMVEYIRGCDHYNVLACTQIYSIRRHSFTPPFQTCFVRELGGKLLLKPSS